MLNIHEIENALRKVYETAHEEYMAVSKAYLADPDNPKLKLADTIATEKTLALHAALDIVEKISWYGDDETAEELIGRIVKTITFQAEYYAKKLWEDDEAKTA